MSTLSSMIVGQKPIERPFYVAYYVFETLRSAGAAKRAEGVVGRGQAKRTSCRLWSALPGRRTRVEREMVFVFGELKSLVL